MGAPVDLHPSEQTLHAYSLGTLDEAAADSVNSHLEQCADCRQRVAATSGDSFLGRLRDAQPQHGSSATGSVSPRTTAGNAVPPVPPGDEVPRELVEDPRYRVIKELGRGGMGVVYLAHNNEMDRPEVLKILNPEMMARRGAGLERFLREIRTAGKLNHPNIVTAYTTFQVGRLRVFAMEYVTGENLADLVKKRGALPVILSCQFIYQAALGLQHAHEAGTIHRDIKPGNLMVARQGQKAIVKVLDFGLAKALREGPTDGTKTQEGQALGTPDYNAPEQIIDARNVDIRADIYSLGCTLYYLLTGHAPFRGNSLYDIYQAHISTDAKPLNLIRPEVPVELAAVVGKMMAKEPARRFQTPAEVADALKPFCRPAAAVAPVRVSEVGRTNAADELDSRGPREATETATPAPATVATTQAPRLEEHWKSLIDLSEPERSTEQSKARVTSEYRQKRPPWLRPTAAIGALLIGFVAWAVISFSTKDGLIVLENLPDEAEVFVDGKKITVEWPGGGDPAEIEIPAAPGKHWVQVKKNGYKTSGDEVHVQTGARKPLVVKLAPLPSSPKSIADNRKRKPAELPSALGTNPWTKALSPGGQTFPVRGRFAAISRDGRRVAVIAEPVRADKTWTDMRIINAPGTANMIEIQGNSDYIWQADFSPDGKLLAISTNDGLVKIWDAETGTEVRRFTGGGLTVKFSPDGTRLASAGGGDRREIHVWDAATAAELVKVSGHSNWTTCLAFSPDGKRLAGGSGDAPGELKVWDLQSGSCTDLGGHTKRVNDVVFSSDGKRLASASLDKTVKMWDLATKNCLITFEKHEAEVWSVSFSPDGRLIASLGWEATVRVWDPETGREFASLFGLRNEGDRDCRVRFSPEGHWIYAGRGSTWKAWETPHDGLASKPTVELFNASEEVTTNSLGMTMIRVEPGTFTMGSNRCDQEKPPHTVRITKAFALAAHEVTQAQYRTVMGDNPSGFRGPDDLPVETVSWLDAVRFCNKLSERELRKPYYRISGSDVAILGGNGYRLPTEAEWEYACGDEQTELGAVAWYNANCSGKTHSVGQKQPNRRGLYDMLGNVWEWCQDAYEADYYKNSPPTDDPPGPLHGLSHVVRGCSWYDSSENCHPTHRLWNAFTPKLDGGGSSLISDNYTSRPRQLQFPPRRA